MLDDTLTDLRQTIAALGRMLDARTGERDEALAQEVGAGRGAGRHQPLFGRPEAGVRGDPSAAEPAGGNSRGGGMTASTRLLRRSAPRNDMAWVVIASGAKQSRSRAALRCSDIFEPMQKSLFNSPSPPLGAERVGVRWGSGRSVVAASPTSPSPSLSRRVPSLSPRKRAERAKLRDGQDASENVRIP